MKGRERLVEECANVRKLQKPEVFLCFICQMSASERPQVLQEILIFPSAHGLAAWRYLAPSVGQRLGKSNSLAMSGCESWCEWVICVATSRGLPQLLSAL